jgi:peptide subunit release factor 1 (eRF1)
MLDQRELQELVAFRANGHPVLSVYLNVDPTWHKTDGYKLRLRHLLEDVEDETSSADLEAVEHYVAREYDWSGKTVAMFSCADAGFWRAYSLPVQVRSLVRVADKPYVKPLANVMDRYGRFVVAVVDRQGAKLYLFHMGELVETAGVLGEEVRRVKGGGGTTAPTGSGSRGRTGDAGHLGAYVEQVAQRNLREAADLTARFCQTHKVNRLILAGTDETVAQFRGLLSKSLQDRVVGTASLTMNASENEVRDRAIDIITAHDHEREVELVDMIITAAAKGTNGVVRLDDTLGALREGRIQSLVISEGTVAPGYQCQGCGYLTAQALETCPFCGNAFREIPDVVEMAVEQVLEQGGAVEVVSDMPALEQAGRIGALLRY